MGKNFASASGTARRHVPAIEQECTKWQIGMKINYIKLYNKPPRSKSFRLKKRNGYLLNQSKITTSTREKHDGSKADKCNTVIIINILVYRKIVGDCQFQCFCNNKLHILQIHIKKRLGGITNSSEVVSTAGK